MVCKTFGKSIDVGSTGYIILDSLGLLLVSAYPAERKYDVISQQKLILNPHQLHPTLPNMKCKGHRERRLHQRLQPMNRKIVCMNRIKLYRRCIA